MTAATTDAAVRGEAPLPAAGGCPQSVESAEQPRARLWPGLVAAALGLAGAVLAHQFVPAVGILTWAVALGIAATNLRVLPAAARPGLGRVTKRLLRIGVVLLGFTVSLQSIAALGPATIALVVVALVGTLVFTTWLANRLKLGRARSLLIGTGFAICGASAIAAMQDAAGADEDDVAVGVAMVTLFGTAAMVLMPLLAGPLGLTDVQAGIWIGASIQEVGQVVAAAGTAGASVVAIAVVVKLTRVLLLAPVVATVSVHRRVTDPERASGARRPPVVPLFVLGFLACAVLRTTGLIPAEVLSLISHLQVGALGIALFGMGAAVQLSTLFRRSGPVLVVAAVSTVFIAGVSLGGIHLLGLG
jgi:uncharacterized integral membrane protein (TIGR00698 family)